MIDFERQEQLIRKYDVPVPRYTSYPTVPYWDTASFNTDRWIESVVKAFSESNDSKGISLYIHLPFCESLCTYCACNTRITINHKVELNYIRTVLKEWEMYREIFGGTPVIRELHLGGGTPTFFSAENLRLLITSILDGVELHEDHEFSFEGHPNNTTFEHLKTLYELGFRRVSFGVQDLDEKVQRTINRIQPFANLERVTSQARELGYTSVSFDLIYGLPFQSSATITNTFKKVLALRPDRVSFYSYAHVPWLRPGQRGYEDADLPTDIVKRQLYELGRTMLRAEGYHDVGMDHFALPNDALYKAQVDGKLHRNFMGYTTSETDLLLGLGTSAVSDAKYAYSQNLKKVEEYTKAIANNELAVFKGHAQSELDLQVKQCILDVSCHGKISQESILEVNSPLVLSQLEEMHREGILSTNLDGLQVTELGRAFVRNICSVFDMRMQNGSTQSQSKVFSRAI